MQTVQIKPVYSIPEFVRDFGVCRTAAYEEMKAGRLRAYKIGSSYPDRGRRRHSVARQLPRR